MTILRNYRANGNCCTPLFVSNKKIYYYQSQNPQNPISLFLSEKTEQIQSSSTKYPFQHLYHLLVKNVFQVSDQRLKFSSLSQSYNKNLIRAATTMPRCSKNITVNLKLLLVSILFLALVSTSKEHNISCPESCKAPMVEAQSTTGQQILNEGHVLDMIGIMKDLCEKSEGMNAMIGLLGRVGQELRNRGEMTELELIQEMKKENVLESNEEISKSQLVEFNGECYQKGHVLTFSKFQIFLKNLICPSQSKVSLQEHSNLRSLLFSPIPFDYNQIASQANPTVKSTARPTPRRPIVIPKPIAQIKEKKALSYPPYFSTSPNRTVNWQKKIISREFSSLGFYHEIPTDFLEGEIFTFRGRVLGSSSGPKMVSAIFRETRTVNKFDCRTQLPHGETEFELSCLIEFSGRFFISLFTGNLGAASRTVRVVSRGRDQDYYDESLEAASAPTSATLSFMENDLGLKWDSRHPLTKIQISQPSAPQSKTYLLSNYNNHLQLHPKDFLDFLEDEVTVIKISEADSYTGSAFTQSNKFSPSTILRFTAIERNYAVVDPRLELERSLLQVFGVGDRLVIQGKSSAPIKSEILLQTPEKKFISYSLSEKEETIPANRAFSLEIGPLQKGTSILEINHQQGYALLNIPIYSYPANYYPLLPDFEQRREMKTNALKISQTQPRNIATQRKIIFDLVNQERVSAGIPPVETDERLNRLAQSYAEDMVARKFSGHYNPEGEGPTERAIKMGILTSVGENLAENPNITDANYRLARSPIHYRNMLHPLWSRIGIGIKLNSEGSFKVVQQFSVRDYSKQPLSPSEVSEIKRRIKQIIKGQNLTPKSQDQKLSEALKQWQYSQEERREVKAGDVLKRNNYTGFSIRNVEISINPELYELLIKNRFFVAQDKQRYGISVKGIRYDELEIFVAFF